MEYLRTHEPPVPVAGVAIGPIHKRDVIAASAMLEHKKEYVLVVRGTFLSPNPSPTPPLQLMFACLFALPWHVPPAPHTKARGGLLYVLVAWAAQAGGLGMVVA